MLSGGDSSADSVVSGSSGNDSDLSNAHPNSISEVDDANSGKYSLSDNKKPMMQMPCLFDYKFLLFIIYDLLRR